MKSQKLCLDEQYHDIQHFITSDLQMTDFLHQQFGDRYDLYLLLSELIDKVINERECEDTLSIDRQLLHFELTIPSFGWIPPLDHIDNSYLGQIIYTNEDAVIIKINSNKFPNYQIVVGIVCRLNFPSKPLYELNGVIL